MVLLFTIGLYCLMSEHKVKLTNTVVPSALTTFSEKPGLFSKSYSSSET